MGNHNVGESFNLVFTVLENNLAFKIDEMATADLLEILDTVGNQYRGSDAEFDDYTRTDKPLGKALIKIFNPKIIPHPPITNDAEYDAEYDAWYEIWYETVYSPFMERYEFC